MKYRVSRGTLLALLTGVILLFSLSAVWAQTATPIGSTNYSGTIAVTSTFQSIQGQTNNRQGCSIQNNGSHPMYVYLGTAANATTALSFTLGPAANGNGGQTFNCVVNGDAVIKDGIYITGTSGDAFTAYFQ